MQNIYSKIESTGKKISGIEIYAGLTKNAVREITLGEKPEYYEIYAQLKSENDEIVFLQSDLSLERARKIANNLCAKFSLEEHAEHF